MMDLFLNYNHQCTSIHSNDVDNPNCALFEIKASLISTVLSHLLAPPVSHQRRWAGWSQRCSSCCPFVPSRWARTRFRRCASRTNGARLWSVAKTRMIPVEGELGHAAHASAAPKGSAARRPSWTAMTDGWLREPQQCPQQFETRYPVSSNRRRTRAADRTWSVYPESCAATILSTTRESAWSIRGLARFSAASPCTAVAP